ncbi:Protoporphyrinogen oxidase [Holothuria leucospilota]|uniref:Protoporphyrinogen oxidase n=1 Tax=Holothuria leucospilota TaxID=206669 RepID=A0A9Q1BYI7_HOLLE|nr:Protoporphyrinogen oxidase [Holothuria leucospilota]
MWDYFEADPSVGTSPLAQRARKERWASWSLRKACQSSYKRWMIEARKVMCSLPAKNLAKILSPAHAHLANLLAEIQSVSVAVINLEFEGKVLPLEGFGYLVPSSEPCQVLGVVFDSCTFPEHNHPGSETTRLTCMMGGAWFEELFGHPESVDSDHLLSIALATIEDHLKIKQKPIYSLVNIHRDCIPQYTVGHSSRLEQINKYIKKHSLPLFLLGSSYDGVSVNECIWNARKTVLALDR